MHNEYALPYCCKCNGLGTIVEMGKCCIIARLAALDAASGETYFAPSFHSAASDEAPNLGGMQNR